MASIMTVLVSPRNQSRQVALVRNRSQNLPLNSSSGSSISSSAPNANPTTEASSASSTNIASGANRPFATNPTLWLLIWTANNVGVTLLNKAAFKTVKFNYPFFLSAIHMVVCMIGAHIIFYLLDHAKMRRTNKLLSHPEMNHHNPNHDLAIVEQIFGSNIVRHPIDATQQRLLFIFSIVFSLNIAVGNVSLKYVSVNFNQVMRSLVPAITIVMGMCLGKPCSRNRIIAVSPIVIGVAMACFGDMSYTMTGFFVTVAAIVLAALKVVASGELVTGKVPLHPVDLLAHMAPLALVQCMLMALVTGELSTMFTTFHEEYIGYTLYEIITTQHTIDASIVILLSGFFSFTLNITSLQANKLTSPLTLCIAANVKQVVLMALSTILFGTEISVLNGCGILIVLIGSAIYSYVSLVESADAKKNANNNNNNATTTKTLQSLPEHQRKDDDDPIILIDVDDESNNHSSSNDIELSRRHHNHHQLSGSKNEDMKPLLSQQQSRQ